LKFSAWKKLSDLIPAGFSGISFWIFITAKGMTWRFSGMVGKITKHKKSIQISGEVDAVQILTIIKIEGLQFRYVIIPFCAWGLDHDPWQAPNLWVTSPESPFDETDTCL